jgi:selenide,water dikinase
LPASGGELIVSNDFADDAAVVRLVDGDSRALVLTADVIAPLVDDPFEFGRIAATNAISDVFAMGGTPLYALNLAFFPSPELPIEVLQEILRGGSEACREVGVAIVGGHTVRDPELKFGLSVTGAVDPGQVLSNRGARAGQSLVLSKALGTGIVGTAIKSGHASDSAIAAALASMTTHNRGALDAARRHGVTACTDVTGFGLLGHLRNILRGSELSARIEMRALPLLPGAIEHAGEGHVPGGTRANLQFLEPSLRRSGDEDPILTLLCADAQTSGGLLLCVAPGSADELVADLRAQGLPAASIGQLVDGDVGLIELVY